MIALLDRNKLLEYKIKEKKNHNNFILHGINTYDKNLINIKETFINSFKIIKYDPCFSHLLPYNLKIYNRMQTNIGSILIHNIKSLNLNIKNFKYEKCDDLNCNVCKYNAKSNIIKFNNNHILPIDCKSSCNSNFFIYIIECTKCKVFYIGESYRTVKERIGEHINSIINFVPYFYLCTPVSTHFNLKNHSLNNFKFYIYKKDIFDDKERFNIESRTIKLIQTHYNNKVLNLYCNDPYNLQYDKRLYINEK
jgi:hypothetical protein